MNSIAKFLVFFAHDMEVGALVGECKVEGELVGINEGNTGCEMVDINEGKVDGGIVGIKEGTVDGGIVGIKEGTVDGELELVVLLRHASILAVVEALFKHGI